MNNEDSKKVDTVENETRKEIVVEENSNQSNKESKEDIYVKLSDFRKENDKLKNKLIELQNNLFSILGDYNAKIKEETKKFEEGNVEKKININF